MATIENRRVALVSIRPKFALSIMSGEKTVEFRRSGFTQHATDIVVYATSPIRQIIGYFKVERVEEATPIALWRSYRNLGNISYSDFEEYFEGAKKAIALIIGEVTPLATPIDLSSVSESIKPPRSFRYLSNRLFASIKDHTSEIPITQRMNRRSYAST